MRLKRLTTFAGFLAGMVLLAGCSTLQVFDTLTPKDGQSRLAKRDIAYGEDERQRLNVYVPEDLADGEAAPVLVFIYGGSWKRGDKDLYDFAGRAFAAQGFVTVIPDYRLVPDVRFPAFVQDGAAAISWVEDNIAAWGGDVDRLYLAGHSAGAYNAVMLGIYPEFLEREGVSPDLVDAVAGLSGPYDFYPFTSDAARDAFAGVENAGEVTQPVALLTENAPPLLLITGTDDETVNPDNVDALAARARALGVPVTVKKYDGLDHAGPAAALSKPFRGTAPVLADMTAFFNGIED